MLGWHLKLCVGIDRTSCLVRRAVGPDLHDVPRSPLRAIVAYSTVQPWPSRHRSTSEYTNWEVRPCSRFP